MKKVLPVFVLSALLLCSLPAVEAHASLDDRAELEAFIDEFVAAQLEEHEIAGATVSIVKDGALLFAKGYGVADVQSGRPVVADETLFQTGSVSKLFTWTALMQLVEQGRVGLHTDVNEYTGDVRIPSTFAEPVTPWHLLTHTPGFEDRFIGLFAADATNMLPLSETLAANVPGRMQPTGESSAYSNYGAALAGHIVANVSGIPFEQYIEDHILRPLDMERASFRQPLPADLEEFASKGYTPTNNGFREGPAEYIPLAPAGALWSTSTDIAKFMIAHLQQGRRGDIRILEQATAEQMHARQFVHAPELNGMGYGFMEMSRNGHRLIGHGGDTNLFHSVLMLAPEHDAGLFVSYNSPGGAIAREYFVRDFVDRYFPPTEQFVQRWSSGTTATGQPGASETDLSRFIGDYRPNRGSPTDVTKVARGALPVRGAKEGGLLVAVPFPTPEMRRFEQVGPLLFREVDGDELIAFRQDDEGQITHLFMDSMPMLAFDRVAWHETMTFHGIVFGLCMLLFLSALIGWPLSAWRRLRRGSALDVSWRSARWAAGSAAGLFVLFCVVVAIVLQDPADIAYGIPPWLVATLTLPLVALIPTALSVGHTVGAWRRRSWSGAARVHYTLVTLAAVTFILQLNYWNLLGFRF